MLIAILEDKSNDNDMSEESTKSFTYIALTKPGRSNFLPVPEKETRTIVSLLNMMSTKDEFKAVHPKVALVLKRLRQKRPRTFESAFVTLGASVDRINTASPANTSVEEERERRKKAALSRQAKVMAHFQQQQKSFLENQASIDWGSDIDEDTDEEGEEEQTEDRKHNWKYPVGTCILCQEEPDDRHLYGTFAHFNESRILRQTDFQDPDFVREASQTPCSLDRSAEDVRPFGIAHENRKMVEKINAQGETFLAERQTIGKGFPSNVCRSGPVASGCGHMMHYRCFEVYYEATVRRHTHQIARHHPEDTRRNEFVCPLCKALGNAFVPIIWKGIDESYPGYLQSQSTFDDFVEKQLGSAYWIGGSKAREDEPAVPDMFTPSLPGSLVESLLPTQTSSENTWGRDDAESHSSTVGTPVSYAFSDSITPEPAQPQPASTNTDGSQLMKELLAAYRRLRNTLRVNGLRTNHLIDAKGDTAGELCASDTLVKSVGFTISSIEVQQRGIEAQPGMTLLEKVPEHILTHLRILSETVSSYIAIGAQSSGAENKIEEEFKKDSERQHCQLFMSRYFGTGTPYARRPLDVYPPLLSMDSFLFLVECSYGLVPLQKAEI
jgi:E3 ubiquitin-protein ligase UBR1